VQAGDHDTVCRFPSLQRGYPNALAASSVKRRVVWATAFVTSATHTLTLVATGTKQLDVDALS
jgi:hypothetical protein